MWPQDHNNDHMDNKPNLQLEISEIILWNDAWLFIQSALGGLPVPHQLQEFLGILVHPAKGKMELDYYLLIIQDIHGKSSTKFIKLVSNVCN